MPSAAGSSSRGGASTMMKVNVSGTLEIPVDMAMLGGLQDPVMEGEILKECARLSVSEKLGCFDAMDVDVAFDSTGKRVCNVKLDLARLGQCIEEIQGAYEHLLAHAELLQALLAVKEGEAPRATPDAENELTALREAAVLASALRAERDAKMLTLVQHMLAGPQSVVEAAAAAHAHNEDATAPTATDKVGGDCDDDDDEAFQDVPEMNPDDAFDYRQLDPDRTSAGKGLLDAAAEDDEEEENDEGAEDGDDVPLDYEAMGYTRL